MTVRTEDNTYIRQIMDRLFNLNIQKVILFGSYAAGKIDEDSDIDLLVVLDDERLPQTYDEWLEIKMQVRKLLLDINNKVAIDLLVYTKPQYEILKKNMNSFQKEIHKNGKVLYAKTS